MYRIKALTNTFTGVSHTKRTLPNTLHDSCPWYKCNYKGIRELIHWVSTLTNGQITLSQWKSTLAQHFLTLTVSQLWSTDSHLEPRPFQPSLKESHYSQKQHRTQVQYYKYTHTCTQTHTRTHTHTHTHTHAHTHTQAHTHTHIHTSTEIKTTFTTCWHTIKALHTVMAPFSQYHSTLNIAGLLSLCQSGN